MGMEVMRGEHDRDARNHDSIVLARHVTPEAAASPGARSSASGMPGQRASASGPAPGAGRASTGGGTTASAGGAAASPTATATNCNLRVTSMKTAKTYQLLSQTTRSALGFYVASHRYMFNVKALQGMLVDPAAFHADVYLQGGCGWMAGAQQRHGMAPRQHPPCSMLGGRQEAARSPPLAERRALCTARAGCCGAARVPTSLQQRHASTPSAARPQAPPRSPTHGT
jgi:hypothetical protein